MLAAADWRRDTASVKEARAGHADQRRAKVVKAVVVRTRKEHRRRTAPYIRFDDNARCWINDATSPWARRVFGPWRANCAKRIREDVSLAPEVW